jgi:hypothetical protein
MLAAHDQHEGIREIVAVRHLTATKQVPQTAPAQRPLTHLDVSRRTTPQPDTPTPTTRISCHHHHDGDNQHCQPAHSQPDAASITQHTLALPDTAADDASIATALVDMSEPARSSDALSRPGRSSCGPGWMTSSPVGQAGSRFRSSRLRIRHTPDLEMLTSWQRAEYMAISAGPKRYFRRRSKILPTMSTCVAFGLAFGRRERP